MFARRDKESSPLLAIWNGQARLPTKLTLTLASGTILAAAACIGSWTYAYLFNQRISSSRLGGTYFRVTDEILAVSFLCAGALWLPVLYRLWFVGSRRRHLVMGVLGTAAISMVTICSGVLVEHYVSNEEEALIAGVVLIGVSAALVLNGLLFQSHLRSKPVETEEGHVDVRCPGCDYLLNGLTELRCPECGMNFTIDELIREQHYDAHEPRPAPPIWPLNDQNVAS